MIVENTMTCARIREHGGLKRGNESDDTFTKKKKVTEWMF